MIDSMHKISEIIDKLLSEENPYSLPIEEKRAVFDEGLKALTKLHYARCEEYRSILDAAGIDIGNFKDEDVPPLAVRLFKEYELKSIETSEIVKVLTSSGTTSQVVSKIFLNRETSIYQTKVLVHIMQSFLGKKRLPMLIIDHPGVIKDRSFFSARGAGILGLSTFGRDHTYALNDGMEIDFDAISAFVDKYEGQQIFVFGFTFMVWQYFIEKLKDNNKKIDLPSSILVHSGGWKKLQDKAVSNDDFKAALKDVTGINRVHNFYGMVEQVGSIYVECEEGVLHAPNFSDIKIKNPMNWSQCVVGEKGVVEVDSLLPVSYPGHKLLTEDLGMILGEDDCPCGRKGQYFSIEGRMPRAEVRGCSDTHESSAGGSGEL